jgi:hypothetical protein
MRTPVVSFGPINLVVALVAVVVFNAYDRWRRWRA